MKTGGQGFGEICLIGNLCVDIVIRDVPELPRWGREVAGRSHRVIPSGQTTYSALALRKLGVSVSVIGYVGDDEWGRSLRQTLRDAGVEVSGIETVGKGRTALTVAVVRPDGERAFVSEFACLKEADESIIDRHATLIEAASVVGLVGTFSFPGLSLARAARRLGKLKERGTVTFLDTGWDPTGFPDASVREVLEALPAFTLFMPNEEESRACSGSSAVADAARLFQNSGATGAIVKLGRHGSYARWGSEEIRRPAFAVDAHDTVGAGDVFNAGFLARHLRGWPLARCLDFASAAAALRVSDAAGSFPTEQQVEDFLRREDDT